VSPRATPQRLALEDPREDIANLITIKGALSSQHLE
jgi:hypothetical protein